MLEEFVDFEIFRDYLLLAPAANDFCQGLLRRTSVETHLRPAGGVNRPDSILGKVSKLAAKKHFDDKTAVFLANSESFKVVRCCFPALLEQNVRKTHFSLSI